MQLEDHQHSFFLAETWDLFFLFHNAKVKNFETKEANGNFSQVIIVFQIFWLDPVFSSGANIYIFFLTIRLYMTIITYLQLKVILFRY